jgi:hypothetical protein
VQVAHSHGGPFVGDGVYDADGAGQAIDEVITRGERSLVVFGIENDGDTADTFVVTGPGNKAGLVARYGSGGEDVTAAVTGHGWEVSVSPDSFRPVQLRIHAPAGSEAGLVRRWVVTATSVSEPGLADAARAAFRVRR